MDATHNFDPIDGTETDAAARIAPRESLFLLGRLYFSEEVDAVDVRIRNLSATGMMVESPRLGVLGDRVIVEFKAYGKLPGHIAWIAEKRMGVALDAAIDPSQARLTVGTGALDTRWKPPVADAPRGPSRYR